MFSLNHAAGSPEEAKFLKDAMALADIPGVTKFEQLRQVSRKNGHDFGFSMEYVS